MAQTNLGENILSLKLLQNGHIYEMVVKERITLSRSKNAASKLTATVLRDHITPEPGNIVAFNLDEYHNQFYGYIITTRSSGEWCDIEAYDQLYYMNRNKMRLRLENITASGLVEKIARMRGYGMIEPPQFEDTKYAIPLRIEENVTDLTMITTALELTEKNGCGRFYIWDDYGSLAVTSESWMAGETTCFITMNYIEDYSNTKTLDDTYTSVRLEQTIQDYGDKKTTADNKTTINTWTSNSIPDIKKYGFLEYFGTVGADENGQLEADTLLVKNISPKQTMSLTGVQGDITVRGGTPILIDFYTRDRREYIRGWYSVESVTHNFNQRYHTMDIECTLIDMLNDWGNTDPAYFSAPDHM